MSDDENIHSRTLGTIGDTEVRIVAEGPKAQFCADVFQAKVEGIFSAIKQQLEAAQDESSSPRPGDN